MNKKDLARTIASETNMTIKDSEKAINAITEAITEALSNGEDVKLVGFCTFKTKEANARIAKNPQTGESISVPSKTKVICKMSKGLREWINED